MKCMRGSSSTSVDAQKLKIAKQAHGTRYLIQQMKSMNESNQFIVEVDDKNVFKWLVAVDPYGLQKLGYEDLATQLTHWAMRSRKAPALLFEITFPPDCPKSVPFMRVIRPRFIFHTGHVTVGGSVCSEMLTSNGWREMAVETLMRSVLMILHDGEARIQMVPDPHCSSPFTDYSFVEAKAAFHRVAQQHGWL